MRGLLPLMLTAVVLSTACGDDDKSPTGNGQVSGLVAIASANSAASVPVGASTTLPVIITRSGSFLGPVTMSVTGLPAGVTASFTQAGGVIPEGTRLSTLTLTASATAVPTTTAAPIQLVATGQGTNPVLQNIALTVTPSTTGSMAITAAPAAHIITAGQTATSTITVTRIGGFAGSVTIGAVANAPAGLTATVATSPITGNTAVITIATTTATVPGNYALTFSATGTGATTRSVPITVIVQPVAAP